MATKTRRAKSASRGCLAVEAATSREAREALEAKVDAALVGSYWPALLSYGRYVAIVYRTPEAWNYKILEQPFAAVDAEHGIGPYEARDEAVQAAACHVIGCGSRMGEFRVDADIPAWLTDRGLRERLLSTSRWQRAYLFVKADQPGIPEHKWHEWACNHQHDARFA